MGYILDILLIAVVIFSIVSSMKKGFIGASKNIITLLLTVILLTSMQPIMLDFLQSSPIGDSIKTAVSKNITKTYEKQELPEDADTTDTEGAVAICEALSLPRFMEDSISESLEGMSEIKNNVMEVITDSITALIMRVLAMILLFVLVRIFVFLGVKLLESLFSLPGLRTINRSLGAVLGILNAILLVYIICGAVSIFAPMDKLDSIKKAMDSTMLLKYFYENNLLMSLFV